MKIERIKQTITSLCLGSALLLLASCSKESNKESEGNELQIEARIASSTSKAIDATNYDKKSFAESDEIKIWAGGANSGTSKMYVRKGDKWSAKDPNDRYTVTGDENEVFSASYPAEFVSYIDEDQTSFEKFSKNNMLVSENVKPVGNKIEFVFKPLYSKITVNITYNDLKIIKSVKVEGKGLREAMSYSSDDVMNLCRVSENGATKKHSFICIIYSGDAHALKITATDGSDSSQAHQLTASAYKPGNNYIFNFTSSDELILTGVTVTPFTSTPEVSAGDAM